MKQYQSLHLNGIRYEAEALQKWAVEKLQDSSIADEEKALFEFILEWCANTTTINCFTSGSTGKPKKIEIEKRSMIASAQLTCSYFQWDKNYTALLALSARHIAGKMMLVRAFVSQNPIWCVAPSLNIDVQQLPKIDFAAFVPAQIHKLMSSSDSRLWLSQIKHVIIGGASLSAQLKQQIRGFSNAVYETFGMTETVSHIAVKLISRHSKENYFSVLGNTHVSALPNKQLVLDVPNLNIFHLITNDLVEIKDSRHFKWLGRLDYVINSGGKKISPEIVENKIEPFITFPFFIAASIDEKWGEKVVLWIESSDKINEQEIMESIKSVLETHEIPKNIYVVKKFETTSSGKINRKETLNKYS